MAAQLPPLGFKSLQFIRLVLEGRLSHCKSMKKMFHFDLLLLCSFFRTANGTREYFLLCFATNQVVVKPMKTF